MSELLIPRNEIEIAQELQEGIDFTHPEEAAELAKQAQEIIGDVQQIYGSKKLIIHSLSGYVINRELTIDEQLFQDQFGELVIKGHFGGLPFVQKLQNPRLQTFMADMYDVTILESSSNESPRITTPVMLPVLSIKSVLVAA